MLNPKDQRLKVSEKSKKIGKAGKEEKKEEKKTVLSQMEIKKVEKGRVGLFFEHNMQLGPPYHILIDTNFINFSIQYKLDIF
mmetsp:Transcript_17262/g.16473  ORF Transcript_17262/g.16473 Transcript_17262/m.16473 type:complete len:82 (+) Transcript_17262:67-312(+)